jgi:hypothetical protein
MAPMTKDLKPSTALFLVAVTIGGVVALVVAHFAIFLVYKYISLIWDNMFADRKKYLAWNRERKKYNKLAARERKCRSIMLSSAEPKMCEERLSIQDRVYYWELVDNVYAPARQHVPHIMVKTFKHLWRDVKWRW